MKDGGEKAAVYTCERAGVVLRGEGSKPPVRGLTPTTTSQIKFLVSLTKRLGYFGLC